MTETPRFENHLRELASLSERAGNSYYDGRMIRIIADLIASYRQLHPFSVHIHAIDAHYESNRLYLADEGDLATVE